MNAIPRAGFAARKNAPVAECAAPQVLHLPFPPGVNNLFKNVAKGRARTDRYDAWIAEAGWLLNQQHPRHVLGPFMVTMVFTRPDNRRRDLDGMMKAPLDLLVKHGVIQDDHLCQSLRLSWSTGEPDKNGGVSVTVEAVR